MGRVSLWTAVAVLAVGLASASFMPAAADSPGKGGSYNPVIDPADFVASINNQYLPTVPGTTFHYESQTQSGVETDDVFVTHDTKLILGVTCTVVLDTVSLEGALIEQTLDWYAQDEHGNVWYFGEDSKQYQNGQVVGTAGSWEAGVNDAKPGIVMEADPKPGDAYRQEYLPGVAEDLAKVLRVDASATVPYGSFESCVETKEWSTLELGIVEHKFYAPGVGFVLDTEHHGKPVRQELVDITTE
jgi:hypothetical protein